MFSCYTSQMFVSRPGFEAGTDDSGWTCELPVEGATDFFQP